MDVRTEDNCRIGDSKVMTNSKGAPLYLSDFVLLDDKCSNTSIHFLSRTYHLIFILIVKVTVHILKHVTIFE